MRYLLKRLWTMLNDKDPDPCEVALFLSVPLMLIQTYRVAMTTVTTGVLAPFCIIVAIVGIGVVRHNRFLHSTLWLLGVWWVATLIVNLPGEDWTTGAMLAWPLMQGLLAMPVVPVTSLPLPEKGEPAVEQAPAGELQVIDIEHRFDGAPRAYGFLSLN